MEWRRATLADAGEIGRLSVEILGDLGEPADIFAERIALCPEGCHVLSEGAALLGHAITHPWRRGAPPAMNQRLGGIPPTADCWYVHEVALLETARGLGHIRSVMHALQHTAAAADLRIMALVAVEGAAAYWERLGFRPAPLDAASISSYGGQAAYLELEF